MNIFDQVECIFLGLVCIIIGRLWIKSNRDNPIIYLIGAFGISIGIGMIIFTITLSHLWR